MRRVAETTAFILAGAVIMGLIRGLPPEGWAIVAVLALIAGTVIGVAQNIGDEARAFRGGTSRAASGVTAVQDTALGGQVPPYRRVRVIAGFLLLQSIVILSIFGVVTGDFLLFVPLGIGLGAATAVMTCLVWLVSRSSMEEQGFRW